MDRRAFLRGSAVMALTGTAGCLLGGYTAAPPDEDPAGTPTPTDAPDGSTPGDGTPTPTATPDGSTPGDETPTATPDGSTPGEGSPTPTTTPDDTPTPAPTPTPTPEPSLPTSVTVEVGGPRAVFDPREFELAVGGTVEWVWRGSDHNLVVDATPSGSDWSGSPGSEGTTYDAGYTYSYTFEDPGEYEYHCRTHDQYGMIGSFTVR